MIADRTPLQKIEPCSVSCVYTVLDSSEFATAVVSKTEGIQKPQLRQMYLDVSFISTLYMYSTILSIFCL